jgi:hypothetical protein
MAPARSAIERAAGPRRWRCMMDASPTGSSRFETWTRRRFGLVAGGGLATLLAVVRQPDAAAKKGKHKHKDPGPQVKATLEDVDDSGVGGFVTLHQPKKGKGTAIVVHANGLTSGTEYVSLYYDNTTCEIEPYSAEDVIGGHYVANAAGIGQTHGNADDNLDEIGSVSVRLASDFKLLAGAKVEAS